MAESKRMVVNVLFEFGIMILIETGIQQQNKCKGR
jgi:hypothetical protein